MAIQFLNTVQVDTSVLYVDTANDRVGVGTTSPGAKLDVYGDLSLGTTGTFTIEQSPFSTTSFLCSRWWKWGYNNFWCASK